MSIKIILAALLTIGCIIMSGIGENIYVAFTQTFLYTVIIALIVSRFYEEK